MKSEKRKQVVDEDPNNTGVIVWRDAGRARGKLLKVEVHDDRHDAERRVDTWKWLRGGQPTEIKMYRREVCVDGARCVVYFVVVREKASGDIV